MGRLDTFYSQVGPHVPFVEQLSIYILVHHRLQGRDSHRLVIADHSLLPVVNEATMTSDKYGPIGEWGGWTLNTSYSRVGPHVPHTPPTTRERRSSISDCRPFLASREGDTVSVIGDE